MGACYGKKPEVAKQDKQNQKTKPVKVDKSDSKSSDLRKNSSSSIASGRSLKSTDEMEKEVQTMLAEEQRKVMIKARPLLDKKLADLKDYVAMLNPSDKDMAASKIQRVVRRRLAVNYAKAKQDWLIICKADSINEAIKIAEAQSNSKFSTLETRSYSKYMTEQDDFEAMLALREEKNEETVISVDRMKSMEKFLRLEKAIYHNIKDYQLPTNISPRNAAEFVEIIRRGGYLNKSSMTKLLGKVYRKMKKAPNITKVTIGNAERLTVVGDLHGQLDDFLYILDTAGMPSITHKYIFNGDFVDRGDKGVEIMAILMVLYIALPGSVVLNRGNHEDFSVCCLYGFQNECCEKYDEMIFGMFSELFQQLPLFSIVNETVFVVHGGLFHKPDVTLKDLNDIDRSNFSLRDVQGFYYDSEETRELKPATTDHNDIHLDFYFDSDSPELKRSKHLQRLQMDALWSDPSIQNGIQNSGRGVAISFGPDITKAFLENNNLKLIIRSHECVIQGYDLPYSGNDRNSLITIFSASDYGGGKNSGAFLSFRTRNNNNNSSNNNNTQSDENITISLNGNNNNNNNNENNKDQEHAIEEIETQVADTNLWYTPHSFTVVPDPKLRAQSCKVEEQSMGLQELIKYNHNDLINAFKAADTENCGEVSKLAWADIMQKCTKLKIRWLTMIPFVVEEEYRVSGDIAYEPFLLSYMEE